MLYTLRRKYILKLLCSVIFDLFFYKFICSFINKFIKDFRFNKNV